jgi:hypothetical protein
LKFIEVDDDGESFFSDLSKVKHFVSFEIDVKIDLPLIEILRSVEWFVINIPSNVHFNIDRSISMIQYERLRRIYHYPIVPVNNSKKSFVELFDSHHWKFLSHFSFQKKFVHSSIFIINKPEQLELITTFCGEGQFADANRWERFIIENLPELLTFNFNFSCCQTDENVIDQYRRPFWLDKHWYVVYDSNLSILFTVPRFAPSSMHHSREPISPDCTTVPIKQHSMFYDCVNALILDSDRYELPYRYNYVKKLILDDVFIHENVLDLSKVQSFIVTNLLLNGYSTRLFNSLKNRCLRLILLVSIVHIQRTIIRLLHWNKFEYYVYLNMESRKVKINSIGLDFFHWSND